MKNRVYYGIAIIITLLFSVYFFSAGVEDWFRTITGRATQQDTNASITVTGTGHVTIKVENATLVGTIVDPTENGVNYIRFYFSVSDGDGVNDINDSSVRANFTRTGESLRDNSSCTLVGDLNATAANYSCTIGMNYFDSQGAWNITVTANDLGNKTYEHDRNTSFQYDQLQGIIVSPNALTWATAALGAVNQTATTVTVINNTGNYNATNVSIRGHNLHGETTTTEFIGIGNITVANNTGSSRECDFSPNNVNANATALVNATDTQVKNAILLRGNNSINNFQTGQEQIYYCITLIPTTISSQTYSTLNSTTWKVKII